MFKSTIMVLTLLARMMGCAGQEPTIEDLDLPPPSTDVTSCGVQILLDTTDLFSSRTDCWPMTGKGAWFVPKLTRSLLKAGHANAAYAVTEFAPEMLLRMVWAGSLAHNSWELGNKQLAQKSYRDLFRAGRNLWLDLFLRLLYDQPNCHRFRGQLPHGLYEDAALPLVMLGEPELARSAIVLHRKWAKGRARHSTSFDIGLTWSLLGEDQEAERSFRRWSRFEAQTTNDIPCWSSSLQIDSLLEAGEMAWAARLVEVMNPSQRPHSDCTDDNAWISYIGFLKRLGAFEEAMDAVTRLETARGQAEMLTYLVPSLLEFGRGHEVEVLLADIDMILASTTTEQETRAVSWQLLEVLLEVEDCDRADAVMRDSLLGDDAGLRTLPARLKALYSVTCDTPETLLKEIESFDDAGEQVSYLLNLGLAMHEAGVAPTEEEQKILERLAVRWAGERNQRGSPRQ